VVLALAALVGVGGGLLLLAHDGDPLSRRTVRNSALLPSISVDLPTLPPTTTTTRPTTLDGLIAMLTANPDAFGARRGDLLVRLLELRDHPDPKGKRAERLARDVEEWVANGELDSTTGALALTILGVSPDGRSDRGFGED
jgi:hypothetical protein